MEFDYFYNRDGDRFSYYMLPKIIVTDERFKNLSSDAKILYSCLLERTSLSFKNKWLDEENRVYIIFTVEEVMETLGRSNKTAVKILNELDSTSGTGSFHRGAFARRVHGGLASAEHFCCPLTAKHFLRDAFP